MNNYTIVDNDLYKDYDYLYEQAKNINYTYIELRDILSLDDYYRTDIHWKQENLEKTFKEYTKVYQKLRRRYLRV